MYGAVPNPFEHDGHGKGIAWVRFLCDGFGAVRTEGHVLGVPPCAGPDQKDW